MNGAENVNHANRDFEGDVWALVADVQRGDLEKFGAVYEHYSPHVFRYLMARHFDIATAEDLTSETFVRALCAIDSVSNKGNDLWAWLFTIVRNLAKDYVRSAQARYEVPVAEMRFYAKYTLNTPDERFAASAELNQVAEYLHKLPSEQKQCIILRRILGLSVSETAARLNRSDGAVRALLYRASTRLNLAKAN